MTKFFSLAGALVLLAALSACGGDDKKDISDEANSASGKSSESAGPGVILDPPKEGRVNVTGDPTAFILSQIQEFYRPGGAALDCYYYAPHSLEVFYGTEDADGLKVCQEANKVAAGQIRNPDLSKLKAEVVESVPDGLLNEAGIGIRDKLLSYSENSEPTIVHLSGPITAEGGEATELNNYYYVKQYDGEWRQILNLTI